MAHSFSPQTLWKSFPHNSVRTFFTRRVAMCTMDYVTHVLFRNRWEAVNCINDYMMGIVGGLYVSPRITGITLAPREVDPSQRTLIAGYTNGVIRTWTLFQGKFVLRDAQKPFANKSVVQMGFSANSRFFACIGGDNSVFFFENVASWQSDEGTVSVAGQISKVGAAASAAWIAASASLRVASATLRAIVCAACSKRWAASARTCSPNV